jgi:alpha-L-fucosidase
MPLFKKILLYLFLVFCPIPVFSNFPENGEGEFSPTWESLNRHKVPKWLIDAKFGVYAHWGIYSVPAFGNEWYAKHMYDPSTEIFQHHLKRYGPPETFGYKDFISRFRAEHYDPIEWAEIIADSGARYAGFAVVHHDGFLLWDSQVNRWNSGKMGPERDLFGELVRELRRLDLKTIATFHHIRTFNWYLPEETEIQLEGKNAGWDLFNPDFADLYWNEYTGDFSDFISEWRAKVKEVIDNYEPDLLWFDGGLFQDGQSVRMVRDILTYFYNQEGKWGKTVEVLNKFPSTMIFNFPREFGVLTFEEGRDRGVFIDRPWIDDQKISDYSWGYVEGQTYKDPGVIIDGFIDRVSRGGGLLLSLCPKADGSIGEEQKRILGEMGVWLRQNGEAIYGTRKWKVQTEGPEMKFRRINSRDNTTWDFSVASAEDIRFTRKGNTLYAIALDWPESGVLRINALGSHATLGTQGGIKFVSLLGSKSNEKLKWKQNENELLIELPKKKPNAYAYAFKVEVEGSLIPVE